MLAEKRIECELIEERYWEQNPDFVRRNPRHDYVVRFALPKVAKLRKQYAELLTDSGGSGH